MSVPRIPRGQPRELAESNEARNWKAAERGAKILTESGGVLFGRVVWTADYVVGFVPDVDSPDPDSLKLMGMTPGEETMLFKSMLRAVTPENPNGRGSQRSKATPA